MALALVDFWQYTSRITHGRELPGRALSGYGPQDAVRAEALFQVGPLAVWQSDDEVARGLHQQSLDLSRRLGNPTGIALALTGLARVALRSDLDRAGELSRQAFPASTFASSGYHDGSVATVRQRACSAGIGTGSASRRPLPEAATSRMRAAPAPAPTGTPGKPGNTTGRGAAPRSPWRLTPASLAHSRGVLYRFKGAAAVVSRRP
jgi:hypothetical protein